MQDESNGVPVKTAKTFMTKIPSVFTGIDLIQWLMKNMKLDEQEALHLANLIASHGYIFPIEDHQLTIKNDCTFYRFQTPCLWPSMICDPENTDYAVYLCKRTMQGKARLDLADYEAENLARLQKMFARKWEFIFMQAETQAKVDKKRDKLERKVLDSQERAFWDVHRPVPGCVNTTELDIKKACRLSNITRKCADCQKIANPNASTSSASTVQSQISSNSGKFALVASTSDSKPAPSESARQELCSSTNSALSPQLVSQQPNCDKDSGKLESQYDSGSANSDLPDNPIETSSQQSADNFRKVAQSDIKLLAVESTHDGYSVSCSEFVVPKTSASPQLKLDQQNKQQSDVDSQDKQQAPNSSENSEAQQAASKQQSKAQLGSQVSQTFQTHRHHCHHHHTHQHSHHRHHTRHCPHHAKQLAMLASTSAAPSSDCRRNLISYDQLLETNKSSSNEPAKEKEFANLSAVIEAKQDSSQVTKLGSHNPTTSTDKAAGESTRRRHLSLSASLEVVNCSRLQDSELSSNPTTHKSTDSKLELTNGPVAANPEHLDESSRGVAVTEAQLQERRDMDNLERELETLKVKLDKKAGGCFKMSKVTQSYLNFFRQWAEYDPFIAQPVPSNPWVNDSTELWDSERQTKNVHHRRVRRWAFSLKELLIDPAGREQFFKFLEKEFSAENLK